MNNNILISEGDIKTKISEIAEEISLDYDGKEIDIICVMNGASFFAIDLVRKLTIPSRLHFLGFSSYEKANLTGEVRITHDVKEPLSGRHLLVIEGVVVSGRTPKFILEYLKLRKPDSIEYCALGIKPKSLTVDLDVKYYGFDFEPERIVGGYGIGDGTSKTLPYLIEL